MGGGMRMVACDLDGTIVAADGSISARVLAAFEACTAAGVDVVFVTGRPPRWMAPVAEATGHRGLAVCGNGALVLDLDTFDIVRAHPLPVDTVLEVARRLRNALPGAGFALETVGGYRHEPAFMPRYRPPPGSRIGELPELLADRPTVLKILCRQGDGVEQLGADAMLAGARLLLAGLAEPVHSNSNDSLLEVSGLGVSKASTLAALAADRGMVAADVVAFGDMPNDVPMLRWAGRGYAMSGGHPEAIAAAGRTAPPLAEDGVAVVLEGLLESGGAAPG